MTSYEWNRTSLVQTMVCRLPDANSSYEPMLTHCQIDPRERNSMKFESKCTDVLSRKCKMYLAGQLFNYCVKVWHLGYLGGLSLVDLLLGENTHLFYFISHIFDNPGMSVSSSHCLLKPIHSLKKASSNIYMAPDTKYITILNLNISLWW